jgi:hypothetical protein
VEFPNLLCGASDRLSFQVTNAGASARYAILTQSDPRIDNAAAIFASADDNDDDSFVQVGPFTVSKQKFTLGTGESVDIDIIFAPTSPISYSETIHIFVDNLQVQFAQALKIQFKLLICHSNLFCSTTCTPSLDAEIMPE